MTNIPKVLTVGKKFLCKGSTNIEKKKKKNYDILVYIPIQKLLQNFGLNDLKSCFWYKHNWKLIFADRGLA